MMRSRLPLLLLGLVFLASVSVSFGIAYWEKQSPSHNKCLQSCKIEKDSYRFQACHARCNLLKAEKEEEEEEEGEVPRHPRPGYPEREHHQQGEKEEEDEEQPLPRPFPFPRPHRPHPREEHEREEEHEERPRGKESGEQEEEDEEKTEREHPRPRQHRPHQREEHERKEEQEQHHRGKESREQEEEDEEEDEEEEDPQELEKEHRHEGKESSERRRRRNKNPFHFNSKRFQTLFRNQYGHIRILPSFNQRSPQLQNLRDYRILEFYSKPNTVLLPHHSDADYLVFVLNGRAILTLVNGDDSESYNLQSGDALRAPSGATYYVVNPDDNENLRIITLAIPVNNPSSFNTFFLSSTKVQQSYLEGFSKNILEASYDTKYEEINKVLFGKQERQQKQREMRLQEGIIVEIPKEQIRELSKRAKSSSRKTISSEDKSFNLRSSHPIYSNNLGRFFEITPEKNPQLKDLDVSLSIVEMNKGALLLPHFNSKSTVILVINEGDANIELVGLKQQQQQQGQQDKPQPLEVRKYRAELSEQDIFVIPAGYPVAVNATSNLNLFAFGINAEDNQRSFLAGEKDNLISQIQKPVLELAFPGSGQDVEKLIKNQRESYFVEAQPQEKEEDNRGRNVPFFSILRAFY